MTQPRRSVGAVLQRRLPIAAERGQAAVETAALAPAVVLLALAAWQGLVLAWADVRVNDAAGAGARALLAGEPAGPAVQAALPPSLRPARVAIRRGRLEVRVRAPGLPGLPGTSLSASSPVVDVP